MRTLTESLDPGDQRGKQTRDWISSLDAAETGARRFAELARRQWNIENGSHRQRDTLWREDHQRMKHHGRAHILATLRQAALCLHSSARTRPGTGNRPARPGQSARISHQAQRLSHAPATAIPLITKDPRE